MKGFSGFPGQTKYTPIPDSFFTTLLPRIDDAGELKVTLHVLWAIHRKRGRPRFVTYRELLGDSVLAKSLGDEGSPGEALRASLERAVGRGALLHLSLEREGGVDDLYFVNTEVDRRAVEAIRSGEMDAGAVVDGEPAPGPRERPNIFELYEQNIGMLSPIIAEQLREAEETYPASWIEDAFKEAVDLNKRSWRYISRILERWAAEGKDDGEHRRHTKTRSDPEEYYRRYGHLLRK